MCPKLASSTVPNDPKVRLRKRYRYLQWKLVLKGGLWSKKIHNQEHAPTPCVNKKSSRFLRTSAGSVAEPGGDSLRSYRYHFKNLKFRSKTTDRVTKYGKPGVGAALRGRWEWGSLCNTGHNKCEPKLTSVVYRDPVGSGTFSWFWNYGSGSSKNEKEDKLKFDL